MELEPVIPFEPIRSASIPQDKQWIAQLKWDGVRMLLYYNGTTVRLINRRLNDRTAQYPELQAITSFCSADSVILDGELIALEDGKPSFHQIMRRDRTGKGAHITVLMEEVPVYYMVFDVLYCNGRSVVEQPLLERQQLLERILLPGKTVQLVTSTPNTQALFELARQHKLEGIVIKDVHSTYEPGGKDGRWQKHKNIQDVTAVVGGVTYRDKQVNALMLGLYDEQGRLWYIGHVGAARLTQEEWAVLTAMAGQLAISKSPFANLPERSKGANWLRPWLAARVHYLEWTHHRTLRQPVLHALLEARPGMCGWDQING